MPQESEDQGYIIPDVPNQKEGDVRVVRLDGRNFCVQRLEKIEERESRRGGKRLGTYKLEWTDQGYYGQRVSALRFAAESAIALGAHGNDTKELIQSINKAEQNIKVCIDRIKEHYEQEESKEDDSDYRPANTRNRVGKPKRPVQPGTEGLFGTDGSGTATQPAKRGRGRPAGSKNRR